jgi:hypothetical protein
LKTEDSVFRAVRAKELSEMVTEYGTVFERNQAESSNWQLQDNGKKGIRWCKEDFMCELK